MKKLSSCMCIVFSFIIAFSHADTCEISIEYEASPGNWCNNPWISFYWDQYDFDRRDWDDGFGYYAVCDTLRPLGRTNNSIYLLNYADGPWFKDPNDFSGNFLHWGGNYTMRNIDELDARCGNGTTATATTVYGWGNNYTQLNARFFTANIVKRAEILIHEARHMDWCDHNGADGSNVCPQGSNCDESFFDGCSGISSPTGFGAYAYEVIWLWWFIIGSDEIVGTDDRKAMALDLANGYLNNAFDVNPCFNITSRGFAVNTC